MTMKLQIGQLSPSTLTRPRGNEAYRKLLVYIHLGKPVEIDLRAQDVISISFLDELIVNLQSSGLLDKVTFIFSANATRERFAEIAALRNARIYYKCDDTEERRPVESKARPPLELRKAKGASR